MEMFAAAAPWLFGLSIPYVIWLDRYMMEPRDGAFAFGQLIIGAAGKADQEEVRNHLRSWLVKGFFLAFMLSLVPGNFAAMVPLGAEGRSEKHTSELQSLMRNSYAVFRLK